MNIKTRQSLIYDIYLSKCSNIQKNEVTHLQKYQFVKKKN